MGKVNMCLLCGKQFPTSRGLDSHMEKHEPWQQCQIEGCGMRFKRRSLHMRRHHSEPLVEPEMGEQISEEEWKLRRQVEALRTRVAELEAEVATIPALQAEIKRWRRLNLEKSKALKSK